MFPSRHAVHRFQQRVAPVTTAEAARRIRDAAASARVRATRRWWTPVAPAPGLLFLYPAALPGVCLLAREGVVVTAYERSECLMWEHDQPERERPDANRRPSPGRRLGEAA